MSILSEFKEFVIKGNAIDMAVGIVVGASFNKVINSLVNDVIMPPIGILIGGVDFKNLEIVLKPADALSAQPAVTLRYGQFVNNVIDFLIVAFSIFMVVKVLNVLKRKVAAESLAKDK